MKTKVLYTDEPKAHESSIGEQAGIVFAFIMLCIVLPVAIFIISMGF